MSLHWYACISTNTYCFEMHYIPLETDWWASSIVQICSAIHEVLANKAFTATNGLISQLFVVAFVHPTYMWIAFIWGFLVQLSLWKLVHWLWRYKLNKVCDTFVCIKAYWYTSNISPFVDVIYTFFYYQLYTINPLVACLYKRTTSIFKILSRVEWSF